MAKFYAYVCAVEAFVARVLLVAMVFLVFSGGIARLIGMPLNWMIDMATCVFAWACLFSADVAWRQNKLMSVEVVTNFLSTRVQAYCRLVSTVIICAFLVYVIPAGFWLAWVSRARAFQGIPGFSYSWVTLALPVGGILLLVTGILKIRAEMRDLMAEA